MSVVVVSQLWISSGMPIRGSFLTLPYIWLIISRHFYDYSQTIVHDVYEKKTGKYEKETVKGNVCIRSINYRGIHSNI